ncbi:MAG: hypothetical protein KGJ79_07805 [Alphaproteobacteria bacterium]|nr:hypothetical protein [Alphaproteobacteria bacterium]MDE2493808.1 hypothetical protein [Alphaproteobacteria bacterium]
MAGFGVPPQLRRVLCYAACKVAAMQQARDDGMAGWLAIMLAIRDLQREKLQEGV